MIERHFGELVQPAEARAGAAGGAAGGPRARRAAVQRSGSAGQSSPSTSSCRSIDRSDSLAKQSDRLREMLAGADAAAGGWTASALQPGAPFSAAGAGVMRSGRRRRGSRIVSLTTTPETWRGALASASRSCAGRLTYGFSRGRARSRGWRSCAASSTRRGAASAATRTRRSRRPSSSTRSDDEVVYTSPANRPAGASPSSPGPDGRQTSIRPCADLGGGGSRRSSLAGPDGSSRRSGDGDPGRLRAPARRCRWRPPAERWRPLPSPTATSARLGRGGPERDRRPGHHARDASRTAWCSTSSARRSRRARSASPCASAAAGSACRADEPGLDLLAGQAFVDGGLGRQDIDEIARIFASRQADIDLVVGESGVNLLGRTTPARPAAAARPARRLHARSRLSARGAGALPRLARLGLCRHGGGARRVVSGPVARLLHDGDTRFGMPPKDDGGAAYLGELRDWLEPMLAAWARCRSSSSATSIPTRPSRRSGERSAPCRPRDRRGARRRDLTMPHVSGAGALHPSREPEGQALAMVYWPTYGPHERARRRSGSIWWPIS